MADPSNPAGVDFGRSLNQAATGALRMGAVMKMGDERRKTRALSDIAKGARSDDEYDSELHVKMLEDGGYINEANDLRAIVQDYKYKESAEGRAEAAESRAGKVDQRAARKAKMEQQLKALDIIKVSAPLVKAQGEAAWPNFVNSLEVSGLVEPGSVSKTWDKVESPKMLDNLMRNVKGLVEKFSEFRTVPGTGGTTVAQYGEDSGKAVNVRAADPHKGKATGGASGIKAADSNAIDKATGELMGGTYHPVTGEFSGLNEAQQAERAAVSSRAEQIFMEGQGKVAHRQAVVQAAREMGVDIRDLGAEQAELQRGGMAENPPEDRLGLMGNP